MAIIRRIKDKLKKIMKEEKKSSSRKTAVRSRIIEDKIIRRFGKQANIKEGARKTKEEVLGAQEVAIEKAKFSTPQVAKYSRPMPQELPYQYGKDKLVLQVRDPWWLHSYWELAPYTFDRIRQELGNEFYSAKRVLRVYDVSQIIFDGNNAHRFFDIEISPDVTNWYIDTGGPGRSWCIDLGLKLPSGKFITILRSNTVHAPLDGPSWITDEEWMVPEEMFSRLYGMGFGLGQSSPVGKAWQERVKKALFSGVLASPGITSAGSPVKKLPKERKFWLVVDCELIVYGATEPDATVYVQGKQIKLRPDGTFSLRYALPDGKQVIPVKGISADKEEERNITPIVTRETK